MTEITGCPWESLKPQEDHRAWVNSYMNLGYDVECVCGASSPLFTNEADAIAAWNRVFNWMEQGRERARREAMGGIP